MVDTAAATKPAKTAPVATHAAAPSPSTSPIRAQKLRAAQIKKFGPSSLSADGFGNYARLTVGSSAQWGFPADWTFADCLNPAAWSNLAGKVAADPLNGKQSMVGSIIALHHPKFYAELMIMDVVRDHLNGPCGLKLACLGPAQDKNGKAAPRDLETGLPWVDVSTDSAE